MDQSLLVYWYHVRQAQVSSSGPESREESVLMNDRSWTWTTISICTPSTAARRVTFDLVIKQSLVAPQVANSKD